MVNFSPENNAQNVVLDDQISNTLPSPIVNGSIRMNLFSSIELELSLREQTGGAATLKLRSTPRAEEQTQLEVGKTQLGNRSTHLYCRWTGMT